MAKGALASAAIEGNSLSEEQAIAAVDGTLELPQSQEYLQQELENLIGVIAHIETEIHNGAPFEITPARLLELNKKVLNDLEAENHVVPGEFHAKGLAVGTVYRGVPAQDCAFLVESMCDWLNSAVFGRDGAGDARNFLHGFLKAAVAHVLPAARRAWSGG